MIRSDLKLHMVVRVLAVVALALAAPLAFSTEGVAMNSACASELRDGSCCAMTAICGLNGEIFPGFDFHPGSCH